MRDMGRCTGTGMGTGIGKGTGMLWPQVVLGDICIKAVSILTITLHRNYSYTEDEATPKLHRSSVMV